MEQVATPPQGRVSLQLLTQNLVTLVSQGTELFNGVKIPSAEFLIAGPVTMVIYPLY
jgi:hypothetical protein